MHGEEVKYNQIEKYLAGEMGANELKSFEAELSKNNALKNEVALHKGIEQASMEQDVINFRDSVRSTIKNESSKEGKTLRLSQKFTRIAATVSIILLVGLVVNKFLYDKSSPEQLFVTYYEPYEDLISGRGDEIIDENITVYLMYYGQKEYSKAVEHLESVDISDKPLLQLYAGISYLSTGAFDKAHARFNTISSGENLFKNEAKWYNALTYLKENNASKARVILEELVRDASKSNYGQKAQALLDELD